MNFLAKLIGGLAAVLAIGGLLGYSVASSSFHSELNKLLGGFYPIRYSDPEYKLIKPLITYHVPDGFVDENFTDLENKLNSVIQDLTKKDSINKVSVYFRDLDSDKVVAINPGVSYEPASLLKVPVMIAYFRKAEADPAVLQKKILYSRSLEKTSPRAATSTLKDGEYYSVGSLIGEMIKSSDNGALDLLVVNIDPKFLYEVFSDLGLNFPVTGDYAISTRAYSRFFRTLYSATYLNEEFSDKALALLSGAEFKDGLVKGLPTDVVVAHKFGIKGVYAGDILVGAELHDCGVVYYPTHPYLLCVFSSGKDQAGLQSFIQEVSKAVYDEVSKIYK